MYILLLIQVKYVIGRTNNLSGHVEQLVLGDHAHILYQARMWEICISASERRRDLNLGLK